MNFISLDVCHKELCNSSIQNAVTIVLNLSLTEQDKQVIIIAPCVRGIKPFSLEIAMDERYCI